MELSQLRSLLMIEREGSITGAAEALNLTQPAVSQQMRALERELGVKLVERVGRVARLTAPGELLRDHARRVVAILDDARQAVTDVGSGASGPLVIGAGVTTSIFHLPELLRSFRVRHPGVEVIVRTGGSAAIAQLVLGREVDVGLVTTPVEHDDLSVMPLYEEEIVLVVPVDHPLAERRGVRLEHLREISLILFPRGSGFRAYLDQTFAGLGLAPPVKMETDSVEAIKAFVAAGLGASFLPLPAVEVEIREGALARPVVAKLPVLTRETSAIYRRDRYRTAGARGFLSLLAEKRATQGSPSQPLPPL